MKNLPEILEKHAAWLRGEEGGERADLSGADLFRAYLFRAYLSRADLSGADLYRADLSVADLSGANLSGAVGLPNIDPFDINSAVYEACSAPGALDMKAWHTCETTHCRAGWAVILHPQGRELEDRFGTNAAAALIYNACAGFVPDFYASNEDAIRDIAEKAGK
jgi:hypothetical protein